ncbi:MAG: acyl-CoA-binding protein [Acidobacteria bacterium]|nr:acyl-CoA-binding protein [Acidobacteriota bacterium]
MSQLSTKFEKAAKDVKALPKRPDNETLLKLYALYKQATAGDVSGGRPGIFDLEGRAKYDAWTKVKGTKNEDAMKSYVDVVEKLKKA